GYPHHGTLNYVAPTVDRATGTLAVRAILPNQDDALVPGYFVRVRVGTTFVEQSIHEVYKTLYEAAILVLIVVLVFLQDWRAMLIPATTVPVTIIGAFAAMAALGFTVNFSTLFAIVLAIGIVVDDAIVVVCRGARPRAPPCASCSARSSASRWC